MNKITIIFAIIICFVISIAVMNADNTVESYTIENLPNESDSIFGLKWNISEVEMKKAGIEFSSQLNNFPIPNALYANIKNLPNESDRSFYNYTCIFHNKKLIQISANIYSDAASSESMINDLITSGKYVRFSEMSCHNAHTLLLFHKNEYGVSCITARSKKYYNNYLLDKEYIKNIKKEKNISFF